MSVDWKAGGRILALALLGALSSFRPARADAPGSLAFQASCLTDGGNGPLAPLVTPHFRAACDMIGAADGYFRDPASSHAPFEWWFGPWDWTDNVTYAPGQVRAGVKTDFALMGNICKGWKFEIRCTDEKDKCFTPVTGMELANLYFNQNARSEPIPIWVCGGAYRKLDDDPWLLDSKAANFAHELSHPCRNETKNDDGPCTQDGAVKSEDEIKPPAVHNHAQIFPPWAAGNAYPHGYFLADLWGRLNGRGPGCDNGSGTMTGCAIGDHHNLRGLAMLWTMFLAGVLCARRRLSMKIKVLGSLLGAGVLALLAMNNVSCARSAQAQAAGTARPVEPPPPLACSMDAPATVEQGKPLRVRVSVKNEGPVPLRVLTHPNALGGVMLSPFFAVRCNGKNIPYLGFTGTYVRTQPGHYAMVGAGETLHGAPIDITESHALQPGRCEIEYIAGVGDVLPVDGPPVRREGERWRPAKPDCGKAVVEVTEAAGGDGGVATPDGGSAEAERTR